MYTVYSAEWCGYCQKAKQLLKETDNVFMVKDIEENPGFKDNLKGRGLKTIPQIWAPDGTHVGGYDDLVEYLNGD